MKAFSTNTLKKDLKEKETQYRHSIFSFKYLTERNQISMIQIILLLFLLTYIQMSI